MALVCGLWGWPFQQDLARQRQEERAGTAMQGSQTVLQPSPTPGHSILSKSRMWVGRGCALSGREVGFYMAGWRG